MTTLRQTRTQLDKRAWYRETRRQEQRSTWPTQTKTEPYVEVQHKHRYMKQRQTKLPHSKISSVEILVLRTFRVKC